MTAFRLDAVRKGKLTLRAQVLQALAPWIDTGTRANADAIRAQCGCTHKQLENALMALVNGRIIERTLNLTFYSVPEKARETPALKVRRNRSRGSITKPEPDPVDEPTASKFVSSGFITPLSKEQLMGRRA